MLIGLEFLHWGICKYGLESLHGGVCKYVNWMGIPGRIGDKIINADICTSILSAQCPVPSARLVPSAQCLVPSAQCLVPSAQCLVPSAQCLALATA